MSTGANEHAFPKTRLTPLSLENGAPSSQIPVVEALWLDEPEPARRPVASFLQPVGPMRAQSHRGEHRIQGLGAALLGRTVRTG